jgi:uncharacterized protein (DUF433 family)
MPKEYVEQRTGGYYVKGTRVSLDSVVYAFLRGESPDGIVESFPALSLEQVYGAIVSAQTRIGQRTRPIR